MKLDMFAVFGEQIKSLSIKKEEVQPVRPRVLSLVAKPPTVNKTNFCPVLNLVQKNVSVIAFRIALTLDVKIAYFGGQLAVWAHKRQKMIFLCVVSFKISSVSV